MCLISTGKAIKNIEINQDCKEEEIGHRMPERRLYMSKEMIVDTEYAGYMYEI